MIRNSLVDLKSHVMYCYSLLLLRLAHRSCKSVRSPQFLEALASRIWGRWAIRSAESENSFIRLSPLSVFGKQSPSLIINHQFFMSHFISPTLFGCLAVSVDPCTLCLASIWKQVVSVKWSLFLLANRGFDSHPMLSQMNRLQFQGFY